jgi:DNA-binding NarL/FixJ family response regulator
LDGLREVAGGGTALSPALTGSVVDGLRRRGLGLRGLTPREREVMLLLTGGASTKEVAKRLGLSTKTVETHRVRIYLKTGATSAVELTRIAIRAGLSDLPRKAPRNPSTPPPPSSNPPPAA